MGNDILIKILQFDYKMALKQHHFEEAERIKQQLFPMEQEEIEQQVRNEERYEKSLIRQKHLGEQKILLNKLSSKQIHIPRETRKIDIWDADKQEVDRDQTQYRKKKSTKSKPKRKPVKKAIKKIKHKK